MVAHANPRVYIGPQTNQIVVGLGRSLNTTLVVNHPNVVLKVKRRKRGEQVEYEWVSFVVDNKGYAHFEIPDDFMTTAKAGFYDALMYLHEESEPVEEPEEGCQPFNYTNVEPCQTDSEPCQIGQIEIVKAPGYYTRGAYASETCTETKWVEPECEVDQPCSSCDCGYSSDEQCPYCNRKKQVVTINSCDGYGLTRVLEGDPPVEPEPPEEDCNPCETGEPV